MPLWLMLALAAPFVGSFLGLLVMRLPKGQAVLFGRSACETCGKTLALIDLIPIASWLWLRGKCRYCGAEISPVYLFMEAASLLIVLWAAAIASGGILIASAFLGWLLLALALIDWRSYLLPDALTLTLLVAGLVAAALFMRPDLADHLIGAAAGFLTFASIAWLYRRLRGREGLGLGDAKLFGALGAWVSWSGLPSTVLIAGALGLTAFLVRAAMGERLRATDRIPFGTFLAAGGWLVWLYGPLVSG